MTTHNELIKASNEEQITTDATLPGRGPGSILRPRGLKLAANYDLLGLVLLALLVPLMVGLEAPALLRVPFGLGMVLLAPGYGLTAAVFAYRGGLDLPARAGLSFGLSLAVVPMLALLLNYLPWGIRLWPMTLSLSLWIILSSGAAAFRRWRLSAWDEGDIVTIPQPVGWWLGLSRSSKLGLLVGVLAIGLAGAYAAYVFLTPDQADPLTEFYALGAEGRAEGYPREIAPGQETALMLGIVHKEAEVGRYRIEVRSEGKVLAGLGSLILQKGQKWEQSLMYKLEGTGDDRKVEVLLFYNDRPEPYRQLRLWVNVREKVTGAANQFRASWNGVMA